MAVTVTLADIDSPETSTSGCLCSILSFSFSILIVLDYVKHDGAVVWNHRFAAPLVSFGSSLAPTMIRVEIYAERFLIAAFIGFVEVPLVKFADSKLHRLKLPLFRNKTSLQDPEALVEFSLQTSVN